MGAGAAVAILLRREKQIVAAFRNANAISPDRSVTLDAVSVHDGVALRRLRNRAVIRDGGPGRYYLDEPSWRANAATGRRVALILLVLIAAMIVMGVVRFR